MCKISLPPVTVKAYYSAQEAGQVNPWWRSEFGLNENNRADGVIVGIVDTGADQAHVEGGDLKGVYIKHRDFSNSGNAWDHFGHGTHVGGIIAALDNEIGILNLQGVGLLNAKALGDDGGGTDLAVAQAIRWCVDEGASVINCSLGSNQQSASIAGAVDYAVQHGVLIVAASGNDGSQNGVSDPADLEGTIAVGAVDRSRRLAPFSNQGARVQCVGPGVEILSTYRNGGYALLSGTSMATPWVTSVFALAVAARKSNISVALASDLLAACCDDLGTAGRDKAYGHGLPVVSKILAAVAPPPVVGPPPVVPPSPFVPGSLVLRSDVKPRVISIGAEVGLFLPAVASQP